MNANELYELLKQTANYFGVGFHGMNQIEVSIKDDRLVMNFRGDTVIVDVNRRIEGDGE